MPVLVSHLIKKYGSQVAVNDISFEIGKGITGFLGPNGAGKSTTMKMITGYLPADSGEIRINGSIMDVTNREAKKMIGYLPESNPLYKDMYVREYLDFAGRLHGLKDPGKAVERAIETVGLGAEAHKKIMALSKGYRQRVGLAAAMVHDPEILILDEPTSGLDPNQLIEIRNVIRSLSESRTILFSSHIMQEVEALCERVIIINKGTIVADDRIENLRSRTKQTSMIVIEFSEVVKASVFESLPHIIQVTAAGNTWRISTSAPAELRKVLLQFSVENNLSLLSMQSEEQDLESVFQSLTL
jgi:ABC-2 type transport system ATP-binding protein